MKMEPIVSSETSAIKSQTPGNYPKRNKLHLQHGESLRTKKKTIIKLLLFFFNLFIMNIKIYIVCILFCNYKAVIGFF